MGVYGRLTARWRHQVDVGIGPGVLGDARSNLKHARLRGGAVLQAVAVAVAALKPAASPAHSSSAPASVTSVTSPSRT
jgi:hypothetical protein